MDDMEISHEFKASSLPVPSPTATHVAYLSGSRLQIRCLFSLEVVRSISLPQSHDVRNSSIAWSCPALSSHGNATPPRGAPASRSNRILVADDETTRIYDLQDEKWTAVITNGTGGMGKNMHVEFGRTEDEVIVFSDFASKATVWCLRTARTVEIKDPKFSGRDGRGWGYRPCPGAQESSGSRGGALAIICRTSGQDVLMLLAPRTHNVIKKVDLPTSDAAGLKWSRDGKWIAVWDAPSSGFNLHIFTADGHLYRTVLREHSEDDLQEWGVEGLGIKSVEWIPGNQWLAVGGWDRRVRILSTRTFSPVVFLDHTAQIRIPSAQVYIEHIDSKGSRSYSLAEQPVTPPEAAPEKNDTSIKQGISLLAFNVDGTICATRDDSAPTTVWIWDLRSLKPRNILIHHSSVKSLQWHPTNPTVLLIQPTQDSSTLYLLSTPALSSSHSSPVPGPPDILSLSPLISRPSMSTPLRWHTRWLHRSADKKPAFIFGHQHGFVIAWPEGKDQILRFEGQEEESDDSLYDILTGRTPVPPLHGRREEGDGGDFEGVSMGVDGQDHGDTSVGFEDTFRDRGKSRTGRGASVFDESGMSEMF